MTQDQMRIISEIKDLNTRIKISEKNLSEFNRLVNEVVRSDRGIGVTAFIESFGRVSFSVSGADKKYIREAFNHEYHKQEEEINRMKKDADELLRQLTETQP